MDATEIIRSSYDYWNKKDKNSFLSHYTESSEITTSGGLVLRGLQGAEMFWDGWQIAFPDSHLTIRALFGSGDQVAVEATFDGSHSGPLHAPDGSQIPPTGQHVSAPYAEFFTVHDGKIAIDHLYYDQLELLTQLSLRSAPAT
jgi:predicted ester cyclase